MKRLLKTCAIGTRFRLITEYGVILEPYYVLLDKEGCGLITKWNGIDGTEHFLSVVNHIENWNTYMVWVDVEVPSGGQALPIWCVEKSLK